MNIDGIVVLYSFLKDRELSYSEKLLLSLFNDINVQKNMPSNYEIAIFLKCSKNSVSRTINSLIKKDYIEKKINYSDDEVFNILKKSNLYEKCCIFCGYSKSTLDEHHYPIRAKNGGTKTIKLCANCHREFHELADYNRTLIFTDKTKRLIND